MKVLDQIIFNVDITENVVPSMLCMGTKGEYTNVEIKYTFCVLMMSKMRKEVNNSDSV